MSIVTSVRGALEKRRAYRKTVRELRSLPLDVALDIDVDRSQAERIAHRVVYG